MVFVHAASDEYVLWAIAMLAFILDVLTTLCGLGRGLAESNPVILALIPAFGPVGTLIPLKLAVLVVTVVAWRVLPSCYREAIPIGAVVSQSVAGPMNTQLILVTVFGQAAGASR